MGVIHLCNRVFAFESFTDMVYIFICFLIGLPRIIWNLTEILSEHNYFCCIFRWETPCPSGSWRWWSMHWGWLHCMVLRTWIAMLIHSTSFVSTLFIFGSVFLNQYIFLSWLLPCLGGNWCGLNWISCFEMTMIQQQLPPLTLLLCWNIGLCSMTLQLHQQMIKVGLMQMDMLCMMLSIHAGMNEITTFWIFCLHTWFYFFSL